LRVIAVTNQKGGSGKTTSVVNLAAALRELNHRVLVIDLDPQASASMWLGVKDESQDLQEVFTDDRPLSEIIRETEVQGVDLAPASPWLVSVERALAGEAGAEMILKRAIEKLDQETWDFVFIDCPPSLGLLSISALVASSEVLVPIEASTMALAGLAGLMKTIEKVRDRLHPELEIMGLLLCRMDRTRLAREMKESLDRNFGELLFKTVIPENVRVREAWGHKEPVTIYAKKSKGAEGYRFAAQELLTR